MRARMKRVSSLTAAALFAAVALPPALAVQSQRYEPGASPSRITLEGTSSMHNWEEKGTVIRGSLVLTETDTACLWSGTPLLHQTISPAASAEIPVGSLTSGKSGMDKNMYATLKADKHPVITYRLESAEIQPSQPAPKDLPGEEITVNTTGIVTVAGKEKRMQIPMRIKRLPDNRLEVSGEASLRMSDFGVPPPKFMAGLLRVGDEVRVRWIWGLAPAADGKTR